LNRSRYTSSPASPALRGFLTLRGAVMWSVLIFAAITIALFAFVEVLARLKIYRSECDVYKACLRTVYADLGRIDGLDTDKWRMIYDIRTKIIKTFDPSYIEF
jgi:hypothetical protein